MAGRLLLRGVGFVHSIEKYVGVNEDEICHGPRRASGSGHRYAEKASERAPVAWHSRMLSGQSCAPPTTHQADGKRWYRAGLLQYGPIGRLLLPELRLRCGGDWSGTRS